MGTDRVSGRRAVEVPPSYHSVESAGEEIRSRRSEGDRPRVSFGMSIRDDDARRTVDAPQADGIIEQQGGDDAVGRESDASIPTPGHIHPRESDEMILVSPFLGSVKHFRFPTRWICSVGSLPKTHCVIFADACHVAT